MSKKTGLVIVAAAVIAYPASSWWLGKMIESAHEEQYRQVANLPYLNVTSRDYQRGIYSATETVNLEISREWLQAMSSGSEAEPIDIPGEALKLTVKTDIAHGPLPHFSKVAAGVADSRLIFSEQVRAEIAKVLGDKELIEIQTTYGFGGGGIARLASPPFTVELPPDAVGAAGQLSWAGLSASVDFARGMDAYTLTADMPNLEVRQGEGLLKFSGMRLSADQKRLFNDQPMFYVGTMKMNIDSVAVAPFENDDAQTQPVLFERMSYDVAIPARGEFIDVVMKLGADTLKVGDQNFGPAHYDISLRNVHARTAATLHAKMMEIYSNASIQAAAAEDPSVLFEPLAEPALALLGHNPELGLDRLSFSTPHGNAQIAARARFDGLTPEETNNPFAMIQKLDASGELSLPEKLLAQIQANEAESEEDAQMMTEMFAQQVEALAAQGYLKREAGILSTRFAFKGGALTVNGLPFDPSDMGGQ
ncbi:MAG: YdgA family protein [Zoogloeaceae bacterium]|nr:YdgA family protein [Zoogloeaceae bacterium]